MRAAFYKATPPGAKGFYNRLIRWWTRSPYSHVELIFSDGYAASSSYMDGGIRFIAGNFDPARWDFIDLPSELEPAARAWFTTNAGRRYDLLGHLHFILGPVRDDRQGWFCSEAVAEALGLPESWRYDPAVLASTLSRFEAAMAA